jgi:hypothetical protein
MASLTALRLFAYEPIRGVVHEDGVWWTADAFESDMGCMRRGQPAAFADGQWIATRK